MSRPIYEPNLPRTDAELGYGNRQLFRRPAPTVEAAAGWPPYPYIYREMTSDSPLTVPHDTTGEAIDFDHDNEDDKQGYFSIVNGVECKVEGQGAGTKGVYEFTAGIHWEDEFDAGAEIRIVAGGFGWSPSVYWKEPYGPISGFPLDGGAAMFLNFRARIFTTADMPVQLQTTHESSVDQVVQQAFLEIAYLGPFAGGDAQYVTFGMFN